VNQSKVKIFATSHVGLIRKNNEDSFYSNLALEGDPIPLDQYDKALVFMVADGMGGAKAGEVASMITKQTFEEYTNRFNEEKISCSQVCLLLRELILECHDRIVKKSKQSKECEGMGTTVVAAAIYFNKLFIAWCGDSRAYGITKRQDNPQIHQLNYDHSVVMEWVRDGQLTMEEAKVHPMSNLITQSLGSPQEMPNPEIKIFDIRQGDRILLCSDGLNTMVEDEEILQLVLQHKSLKKSSEELIKKALENGGKDNVTVLEIELEEIVEIPDYFMDFSKSREATREPEFLKSSKKSKNTIITVHSDDPSASFSINLDEKKKSRTQTSQWVIAILCLALLLTMGYIFINNSKFNPSVENTEKLSKVGVNSFFDEKVNAIINDSRRARLSSAALDSLFTLKDKIVNLNQDLTKSDSDLLNQTLNYLNVQLNSEPIPEISEPILEQKAQVSSADFEKLIERKYKLNQDLDAWIASDPSSQELAILRQDLTDWSVAMNSVYRSNKIVTKGETAQLNQFNRLVRKYLDIETKFSDYRSTRSGSLIKNESSNSKESMNTSSTGAKLNEATPTPTLPDSSKNENK